MKKRRLYNQLFRGKVGQDKAVVLITKCYIGIFYEYRLKHFLLKKDNCVIRDCTKFDFDKKVYTEKYELEGTWYKVRDVAGLGIEIDENEAVKHDFQYWETPHLHRKDGSLTNW